MNNKRLGNKKGKSKSKVREEIKYLRNALPKNRKTGRKQGNGGGRK